jgi:hypothetical protein
MSETPLLDWIAPPNVRMSDPDTSHKAAKRAPIVRAADRRAALIAHRWHLEGLTDFELGDLINRQQTSAGKRRGELRDLGLICDSGERRASPSGSSAIVWTITEAGKGIADATILRSENQ